MFASSSTTSSSQITESDKVGVSILVSMYLSYPVPLYPLILYMLKQVMQRKTN